MIQKAPNLDFSGNDPFWVKWEGFGATLYFPAFHTEKSQCKTWCHESTTLVFGSFFEGVPMSFVIAMMNQGRIDAKLRKDAWLRPAVAPCGNIVIAVCIGTWASKEDDKNLWSIGQDAYNVASGWYRKKVLELWDQAKMAKAMFDCKDDDREQSGTIDVEVVKQQRIEA